jgi:cbb3-type cytochrome oxidase subunit 3
VDDLGAGFWLKAVGLIVAIGIGGIILFSLIGMAWYAWGALGTLLFFFLVLAGVGWMYDRTHKKRYDDLSA